MALQQVTASTQVNSNSQVPTASQKAAIMIAMLFAGR